jgi:hypothetical protein
MVWRESSEKGKTNKQKLLYLIYFFTAAEGQDINI